MFFSSAVSSSGVKAYMKEARRPSQAGGEALKERELGAVLAMMWQDAIHAEERAMSQYSYAP